MSVESSELREGLDRLADEAGSGVPPTDLWRRGVRRRRRRLAGGVVAAMLVVVAGGGLTGALWGTVAPTVVGPVAPASTPAIPDRVDTPSPWGPAASADHPVGPLAVVKGASRSRLPLQHVNGLVGVSAGTGEYRFLDLPGWQTVDADRADVALSPDGRWLAYWTVGKDIGDGRLPISPVTGVAAYDTVTGRVLRAPISSRLGLDPTLLAWVGADRLAIGNWPVTERLADGYSATARRTLLWTPGSGDPVPAPGRILDQASDGVRPAPEGLTVANGTRVRLVDDDLRPVATYRLTGLGRGAAVRDAWVSPDGRTLAAQVQPGSESGSESGPLVVTARLPVGGGAHDVATRRVTAASQTVALLGWRDAGHLVVRDVRGGDEGAFAVDADPAGSATRRLVRLVTVTGENWSPGTAFASDLWAVPTVSRPGPPTVTDPRLVGAAGAGVVLVALVLAARRWGRRGVR